MKQTKIEWCTATVNPVVGCTYGCEYCYAHALNRRFGYIPDFSTPTFFPGRLEQLKTQRPQVVFLNSMSDVADWEPSWMGQVLDAAKTNRQHFYLMLTKREQQTIQTIHDAALTMPGVAIPNNLFVGATISTQQGMDRLLNSDTALDFISVEPMHGSVHLPVKQFVKWVIIGAETGNRKGKIIPTTAWVRWLIRDCDRHSIPVFCKDSLLPIIGEDAMRRDYPTAIKAIMEVHQNGSG